ncbi:isopentenyl phosphate kinase [Thermococcus sp.]|uniref:isopentenyl phosphate kinase n=1 Tax=Thermococcus sp. TaxID=35749 RepID=UPI002604AAA9|nr:isopentenyl phosphate kinase [Thermococcus sp.]
MIIVKIGGSVFSDKSDPKSFREDVVREIASELGGFYPENEIIVVHGGGSFGHPLAQQYRIREGIEPDSDFKRVGFSLTHQAMLEVNDRIVEAFLSQHLPAFSVSSSSVFLTEGGEVAYGDVEVIKKLLELNFIPVLFGDVSVDLAKGVEILSGDQIIAYLAKMFRPEKVIFLMDVDGIYDGSPGEGGIIQDLTVEDIEPLLERLRCTVEGTDVTGGICNKLLKAREIAEYSEVWFVNGRIPGRLGGAIAGQGSGTRLRR